MRHLTTYRVVDAVARTGSIRRAAETLALTPSAVQRRVAAFEDELGQPIFERLATGVRLNAAGELVLHHIREEFAGTERLRSRLADLAGVRRGHVAIACSQALAPYFLPAEIAAYRTLYPQVTFDVRVLDHIAATSAVEDFSVDLAIVYGVDDLPTIDTIAAVRQDIAAIVARGHPLAGRAEVRLREVLDYPLALPHRSFEGRRLFDRSMARKGLAVPAYLESNSFEYLKAHVACTDAVAIQIPIGAPPPEADGPIVAVPIAERDLTPGMLTLRQLKGRTLSVAAARFVDRIRQSLSQRFAPV
ncbi:LysR family transcriptional regulator [Acuticoccus sp. I52.16.1]|uniref:LysR family transcriptional regulator n=1 Tax=Acuticoccus sp. I52.16.1 TaxID=2928472 RepID=UPI001FD4EB5C|nr:LysR substrate-binding domain-containing protein [Acuticoccus sp. I52.16.1]UOM33946.1 LysR substrate-binding domain-containing protein [Acuticoccus sp. I52.16.1]